MKLLLAEDEKELSRALVTILEKFDFQVTPVYDGAEALASILENTYDGIIMDIMMPKMDGLEVLKSIRRESITTPVLLLTAKSDTEDIVDGLSSGADDYLTKPFATRELIARVQAMVRTPEELIPSSNGYGNIVLSHKNNQLSTKMTSVGLSSDEFYLMELLLQNKEKSLSKDVIVQRVWKEQPVIQGQLELYISYLQKKLEAIGSDLEIQKEEDTYKLVKVV